MRFEQPSKHVCLHCAMSVAVVLPEAWPSHAACWVGSIDSDLLTKLLLWAADECGSELCSNGVCARRTAYGQQCKASGEW